MSCLLARWLYSPPAGTLRMLAHALFLFLFGAKGDSQFFDKVLILDIVNYNSCFLLQILCQVIIKVSWHLQGILKDRGVARVAMQWLPLTCMKSARDVVTRRLERTPVSKVWIV